MKDKKIRWVLGLLIFLLIAALGTGYWTVRNRIHEKRCVSDISKTLEDYVEEEPLTPDISGMDLEPEPMPDASDVYLNAETACVYRVDGKNGRGTLIYDKDADKRMAQASTTKLMTAILLIESGKLEDDSLISANAASTSQIWYELEPGDVYSNYDLMYAMMLPSANDAAVAIAEGVSGNVSDFVDMMNERASELRLRDTHFVNPHGLDEDDHYSTARDVAKLTAFAYTFPDIREAMATQYKTITGKRTGNTWDLESTTLILGYDDNFKGGKTGTQPVAGFCYSGVYEYEGKTYITVVLNCDTEEDRWIDTKRLHQFIRDTVDESENAAGDESVDESDDSGESDSEAENDTDNENDRDTVDYT